MSDSAKYIFARTSSSIPIPTSLFQFVTQNFNILVKTKNAPEALKRKKTLTFFVTWLFQYWGGGAPFRNFSHFIPFFLTASLIRKQQLWAPEKFNLLDATIVAPEKCNLLDCTIVALLKKCNILGCNYCCPWKNTTFCSLMQTKSEESRYIDRTALLSMFFGPKKGDRHTTRLLVIFLPDLVLVKEGG